MKRVMIIILSFAVCASILSSCLYSQTADSLFPIYESRSVPDFKISDAELVNYWISYEREDIAAEIDLKDCNILAQGIEQLADGVRVEHESTLDIKFVVPSAGNYSIMLEYSPGAAGIFENNAVIKVNKQELRAPLQYIWQDVKGVIKRDKYGNEIVPEQMTVNSHVISYIENFENFDRIPVMFELESGENSISITPETQAIIFYNIKVLKPAGDIKYSGYSGGITSKGDSTPGSDFVIVEGEQYRAKSDSFIRGRSVKNSAVYPGSPYVKLINAIDDKSNKAMGQKILYEFEIENEGVYYFAVKYCQPLKAGVPVFRTIEIDGKVPFAEMRDYKFYHTGLDKYENNIIDGSDGAYGVYLTKGLHTVAFKTTAAPFDNLYKEVLNIISEMNETTISIKKVKGNNADVTANVDKNRTWDITQYMPGIVEDITDWQNRITSIYERIKIISGQEPSLMSDLKLAVQNLEKLKAEPVKIPAKLGYLSDESSSAAQLLGTVLTKLYDQNLSIDRIYVYGNKQLPSPHSSFPKELSNGVAEFLHSFSPEMNKSADSNGNGEKLAVWINKPMQYVEVLQELTDNEFTQKTGIDVSFSIMPNEQKIILANSSDTNPDAVLGLSYYLPFDLALRGVAKNLLDYDDFISWYSGEYNLDSLTPMSYNGGVYGASETQDFYVLFYRKDILEMLGLEVPKTMDDVCKMMPVLHRNAMNFNLPLANNVGYKSFFMTLPYIYQNGGDFYTPDGVLCDLNNQNTLKGLSQMVDFYRIYGMAQNIPNFFNSFKSGAVPIGVSNFATYIQLQLTAPEMAGLWDIALAPGTIDASGNILRYQSADTTAAMIFNNSPKTDEAYKFLKWWLSRETQLRYSNQLQIKFGPDFIWNTANIEAFKEMQYPESHKKIILEQWSWQKEIPRHPASYMIEREVSNLWNDVVVKGKAFRPRVDSAIINCNREMIRKLTEFGYYDDRQNQVRDYEIDTIDSIKKQYNDARSYNPEKEGK